MCDYYIQIIFLNINVLLHVLFLALLAVAYMIMFETLFLVLASDGNKSEIFVLIFHKFCYVLNI
jgi:hypothetical protein